MKGTTLLAAAKVTGAKRAESGGAFASSLELGVREHVRLEVGALREPLAAAADGADEGPAAGVNADVRAQVEVEAELLAAAVEGTLEGLLARVHQLVPLQLRRLHKGLAALAAHVHARPVRVQVLAHGGVVAEEFGAAGVGAEDAAAAAAAAGVVGAGGGLMMKKKSQK